ncbi:hypothetical protein GIB67_034720, partial [Kingdonia uniflora]
GVNGPVFVFYEHLLSTVLLSALAFLFERITLCQLLLTSSLGYISATFQSTALNTTTAVVFVLAVIFRQEAFTFYTVNGQAKLWGIALSFLGATVMLLYPGPELHGLAVLNTNYLTGGIMVVCAILATSTWIILVERVATKYPAKMCLSAMMSLFGTLQVAIVAIVAEREVSAWKLHLDGSFELLAIIYGGIVVTGLSYYAQTWCIHKKGPVFTSAFSPLLIVFSFILETTFLRKTAHLWSIAGAVFVVAGLYLILWAKAVDTKIKKIWEGNTRGVNGPVFVLYEHSLSTILLSALAFVFERRKRPAFTFYILRWAFLLGFLQITLCQLLLTSSLRYISATFLSTALNTTPAVVFVLAVIFRQEVFTVCTINGQAKLWRIALSFLGAIVTLLYPGPEVLGLAGLNKNHLAGVLMVICGILATSTWIILVERVSAKYPAKMCLAAMMTLFGTLQVAIVAIVTEREASSWELHLDGSFELLAIVYGGIVVTGVTYYAQTWCIHKKGPVFASAFSPLLIVFSFLLETVFLGKAAHLCSIVGAVLVVVGLYLILWAKAGDIEKKKIWEESTSSSLISPAIEP